MSDPTPPFERLGGEPALRAIIDQFVDAVFDDIMIGFHFRAADRARVKAMEYEHAARHLGARAGGAPTRYTGRPLREVHARHPILGGQFDRRLKILEEVLEAHGVPPDVRQAWLAHDAALRDVITGRRACGPEGDASSA